MMNKGNIWAYWTFIEVSINQRTGWVLIRYVWNFWYNEYELDLYYLSDIRRYWTVDCVLMDRILNILWVMTIDKVEVTNTIMNLLSNYLHLNEIKIEKPKEIKKDEYNYIFVITIYNFLISIDEEFIEAKYITLYSLHKQKEIKENMEEIKNLKSNFYNKHGNILSKINNYLFN